jgi:hypothetical protein
VSDDATPATTATTEPGSGESAASGNGSTPKAGAGLSIEGFSPEAQDYIKRLRAEAASHRNDLKSEREKREALETASMSEQEKRDKALKDAESKAAQSDLKLLRFQVAADKELPLKMAERLKGSTKEELEADADALKEEFGLTGGGGQAPAHGGFDGGVRRPVTKPNSMNGLIRESVGR